MNHSIQTALARLQQAGHAQLLRNGLKGLEKESLRITPAGEIAQTSHPTAIGSALTHPNITTDYSEALIELVTPPFQDAADTLEYLDDLHQFVYDHLTDELLLATSMPPRITGEESIPIARYGSSNIGRMKHIYRQGLAYRYGRAMQAIAGVHFNYSVAEELWPAYQDLLGNTDPLPRFIADRYFGMVRNVHRYGWLVLYLFGHSPALCKSFFAGRERLAQGFTEFDAETWYRPYATSLRMSDIGYKNDSQSEVNVCFDDLDQYVASLTRAIETPYPPYERIGVKVDGEYRQLNTNLLQIENEYYSPIRPKQVARSGEKPTRALKERGVRYLELRSVDLNCFHPNGIALEQLQFLETFLIACLLAESPRLDDAERAEVGPNALAVACCGRTPNFTLRRQGRQKPLKDWAREILDAMAPIAELLDGARSPGPYRLSLVAQMEAVHDPERTPSARILAELRGHHRSFAEHALELSQKHAARFRARRLAADKAWHFANLAAESLQQQRLIESGDTEPFDEFLERFLSQR